MWLTGKTSFVAISLALVVLVLHEVRSDDDGTVTETKGTEGTTGDEELTPPDEVKIVDEMPKSGEEEEEEEFDEDKIEYEVDNDVYVLKDDNFMDWVVDKSKGAPVLVEFYAPWCGHCKSLAPEYERAAKKLKDLRNPVYLAKVDATEEKEIAEKYEVTGYPTLKWFRDGQAYDYDGPRDEEGIIEYMKKRAAPDWKPPPIAVVTLTSDNFTDFVNENDLSLVQFYAPWCGHCKKLAPEYEKAAQKLKEQDQPIPLAKVDATANSELGQEYGVSGYPTLKVFRRGVAYEYKGDRNEYSIVSYMQKQTGDPSREKKSQKDLQKAFEKADVTVVGFFTEEDFTYKNYLSAVNGVRDDYTFLHTFDAAARDHYKVNVNSIVVFQAEIFYTRYESKRSVLEITDETKSDEILDFLSANNKPLVGEFTKESKRYEDRPIALFFYDVDFSFDGRTATQLWRNKIAAIANDYKGKLTFAVADEEKNKDLFKSFGFEDSGEEMNVGVLGKEDRKYPMDPDDFDADAIRDFVKQFLAGKAKPIIKSQPMPKKQGVVKTVVGKNFEKIVMDPKKDVLIELYAPWCGHCKKLEPTYKELAKKLKGDKNLVIAKMDATANDAPPEYSHSGFPTIYFAPAADKLNPVKFEGGRELEDFENFLKEQATVSFGADAKPKEEL